MDLADLAAKHRAAWAAKPADVRNVRPSIREFERYVTTGREELAVIGELRRKDPDTGPLAAVPDAPAFAAAVADGGAYGVCVAADEWLGGSLDDVRAVSAAASIPVLSRGLVLDEQDLYRHREAGADAVVLYAALLDPARITALRKAARSMRIEAMVEVFSEADLANVLASEATILGVSGVRLDTGRPDLAHAKALLERIPKGRTPILSGGVRAPADLDGLLPLIDAVIVREPLMAAAANLAPIARLIEPFTVLV